MKRELRVFVQGDLMATFVISASIDSERFLRWLLAGVDCAEGMA